jgi:RNA polymerase sigma factor for flagellar operon FliA
MTMKEIGATLDLSESRVSHMHSPIIMRLKAQMANKDKEFVNDDE